MNTKTRVTLFCHRDKDIAFIEQRIERWFGGAAFPDKLLESQVFVFSSPDHWISDPSYSAACDMFDRDGLEAAVFEYDRPADLFVRRSRDWIDKHYDSP